MTEKKRLILLILSLAGLATAILAGLSEYIPFLQAICTSVSHGCKQTAEITMLRLPVWVWGAVFYALAPAPVLLRKNWLSWAAPCAAGVEAVLIWIMVLLGAACVFCIANAVIVVLLLCFSLEKERLWRATALVFIFVLVSMVLIPVDNGIKAFGIGGGVKPEIAGRIDNDVITEKRLEITLGSKLADLKQEIYRLKKDKLESMIDDTVLEKEAAQKGMTVEQYVNELVPLDSVVVSDEEIDAFIKANAERLRDWKGTPEELRERVRSNTQQQKRVKEIIKAALAAGGKYGAEITLTKPETLLITIDTKGCPEQGPANALVTVIEFSDYQCPACRASHPVIEQVKAAFQGQIRWIYKDLPLKAHKNAFRAAEAAHCAGAQGKFWEYQTLLFGSQTLDDETYEKLAKEMGLSEDDFGNCLRSEKYKDMVEKNMKEAFEAGVDRTPCFSVNGNLLVGAPAFERFKAIIESELRRAGGKPQSGETQQPGEAPQSGETPQS